MARRRAARLAGICAEDETGCVVNQPINIDDGFALFAESWSPKVVARLNDYEIKLVRLDGEFGWHTHDDTDELFLVSFPRR